MSVYLCVVVLTILTVCAYGGIPNKPTNVLLTSHNMNLVLRWDPPEGTANDTVYTTEYNSVTIFRTGCVNISTLQCDFTPFNLSVYGKYTGRVWAVQRRERSMCAESNTITLDKDSFIDAPIVTLLSNGPTLEVIIKDPLFWISTLRDVYNSATYNITYWKKGQKEKARFISNVQQNRVVLNDLDPLTKYCVQAQINTDRNRNPSNTSDTVCESTTNEKESLWMAVVVVCVVLTVAVVLVVVTVVHWKSILKFFYPKDALPLEFIESLPATRSSPVYLAMRNSSPVVEKYDPISVSAVDELNLLEAAGSSCSKKHEDTERRKKKRLKNTD
ncbi:interleukin-10 receptor subunit beta-like isoform X2 [Parambassis ranga]|uniref:Interleukin-10 receptor subunit beta-like isoform X2 n=1 Tax=Parambassis ranga TaxID=210632 RepID=A0A6P7H305_9TELE|nr:interleukin-10 receptor subunit beta-like isoform X2 [Parambassis ranga]